MKNKASNLLKQILSVVTTIIKDKSIAVKSKTSAMKARLLIFGLLKNKKVLLPGVVTHKIHALISHVKGYHHEGHAEDPSKAIVAYNTMVSEAPSNQACTEMALFSSGDYEDDDDDDKYPDLTHSLFDELEFDNGTESVVDLVKNSREDASNFNLEDEIDHVADVFIRRFHRRMQMQKQDSFKMYQEMLDRSV